MWDRNKWRREHRAANIDKMRAQERAAYARRVATEPENVREQRRAYYQANRDKIREQQRAYVHQNLDAIRESRRRTHQRYKQKRYAQSRKAVVARQAEIARIKLERGCEVCGYSAHHYALEFAHRDPREKRNNVARMQSAPWERVLAEMAKCRVLCKNCHAIETYEQGHNTGARGTARTKVDAERTIHNLCLPGL